MHLRTKVGEIDLKDLWLSLSGKDVACVLPPSALHALLVLGKKSIAQIENPQ